MPPHRPVALLSLVIAAAAGCSSPSEDPIGVVSTGAGGASGGSGASGSPPSTGGQGGGASGSAGWGGGAGPGGAGGLAGSAGAGGLAGSAGSAGAAGSGNPVFPCGNDVPCSTDDVCFLSDGGECVTECQCDKSGHFVCAPYCSPKSPTPYPCADGGACASASVPALCTYGNTFCTLTCACTQDAGGEPPHHACKQKCSSDGTPSQGKPCGEGVACEAGSQCGVGLTGGCTVNCSCGPAGLYECTYDCPGP